MDGESWGLTVEYADRAISSYGVNRTPEGFNRYRFAIYRLARVPGFGGDGKELELYDADELRLVATSGAAATGRPWADFRVPDGKVFRARPGSYIGYARVAKIARNSVTLMELEQDKDGDWIEREKIVTLAEPGR